MDKNVNNGNEDDILEGISGFCQIRIWERKGYKSHL